MYTIRFAQADDVETLVTLIKELAAYEKLADEASPSAMALTQHLFGANPVAEALIAENDFLPIGFALFFRNYSTFRARPGVYLEDLFVRPEHRGRGVGKALLGRLAKLAVDRGCARLEWAVLDWNEPAIGFYKGLGARLMTEWTVCRLEGDALDKLAVTANA
jgi:GNAT superfamily N-acetyltransferase